MTHQELAKLCYDCTAPAEAKSWDAITPEEKEGSLSLVHLFLAHPNTNKSNSKARIYSSLVNDLIGVDSNDALAVAKAVKKAVHGTEEKDEKKSEAADKKIEKEFVKEMGKTKVEDKKTSKKK